MSDCQHERFNSRADCPRCFGRDALVPLDPDEQKARWATIERLASFLADPDCDISCHGEGIDYEGAEWELCECVQNRLAGHKGDCVDCGKPLADHPPCDAEPPDVPDAEDEANGKSWREICLLREGELHDERAKRMRWEDAGRSAGFRPADQ